MEMTQLLTMANQIGDFFKAYPDEEQAKQDIAQHLKRFWTLKMRQQIIAHIQNNPQHNLQPIVQAAILEHLAKDLRQS